MKVIIFQLIQVGDRKTRWHKSLQTNFHVVLIFYGRL